MTGAVATTKGAVEIVGVHTDRRAGEIRGNLETPSEGESMSGFWVPLTGWILSSSGNRVQLRISDGLVGLRQLAADIKRPDVAAVFPDTADAANAGFSVALGATRLAEQFELSLSALVGGEWVRFALVQGTRRRFEPTLVPHVAPLAVTTLGRTGSTLLMTLLSRHPAIWAFDPTSNDARPLAQALGAATALAAPGSRIQVLQSAGAGGEWWLERDPLPVERVRSLPPGVESLLLGDGVADLLTAALRQATWLTRELAFLAGRTTVGFAAEKGTPGYVPRLLHELCYETREIFLVRDFRDVLASILAFNAKRGYAAFGREDVDTDRAFVERFVADVEMLVAAWLERRGHAHLVRYEDLVADADAVLEGVLGYLALDSSGAEIGQMVDSGMRALERTHDTHKTTASAAESMGRWRRDLPDDVQEVCATALKPALAEFGYTDAVE